MKEVKIGMFLFCLDTKFVSVDEGWVKEKTLLSQGKSSTLYTLVYLYLHDIINVYASWPNTSFAGYVPKEVI